MKIKLKICGLRDNENIPGVTELNPDYVGFIFYSGSSRYAGPMVDPRVIEAIPAHIKKVGVFVDEPLGSTANIVQKNQLNLVQLHGNESPPYCVNLKRRGLAIIKSFRIGETFNFEQLAPYLGIADYFLFDTKGTLKGGTGEKFKWEILDEYPFSVPFFLSGGISLDNIDQVFKIRSEYLYGIDVNSRFETAPGVKDLKKLKILIHKLSLLKREFI
jgi:phosphoribosylanthranilate isomerase